MKYLVISGNPKSGGLCRSVQDEVERGARDGGAEVFVVDAGEIGRCRVCGDGWGPCRENHECAFGGDGFDKAQQAVREADAICLITPVYWGESSESMKALLDRLRRCQFGAEGAFSGKPVLLVASPGGTGNGMVSCFDGLDRFCKHVGARVFDYIGVNRNNCEYKRNTAYSAALAMTKL